MHTALMAICIDNNYFEVDGYLYYTESPIKDVHVYIKRFHYICNTSRCL